MAGMRFKTAFTKEIELSQHKNQVKSRWRVIVTLVAVTWLNPHVYLDTFVVLGSIGGQLSAELRPWFTFGAVFASISWFFCFITTSGLVFTYFKPSDRSTYHQLVCGVCDVVYCSAIGPLRDGKNLF
ncbi:arginine exporter protein [Proteus mirabilis]|uniref:Arginine exporter protein n=1 Tax=Proteus mirabilis TaxID=584 RepID=A0A2X2C7Y1_PROMI|nr:arginine exporter protein [Proteus mirabilis]